MRFVDVDLARRCLQCGLYRLGRLPALFKVVLRPGAQKGKPLGAACMVALFSIRLSAQAQKMYVPGQLGATLGPSCGRLRFGQLCATFGPGSGAEGRRCGALPVWRGDTCPESHGSLGLTETSTLPARAEPAARPSILKTVQSRSLCLTGRHRGGRRTVEDRANRADGPPAALFSTRHSNAREFQRPVLARA